jgi:hypothetical protein
MTTVLNCIYSPTQQYGSKGTYFFSLPYVFYIFDKCSVLQELEAKQTGATIRIQKPEKGTKDQKQERDLNLYMFKIWIYRKFLCVTVFQIQEGFSIMKFLYFCIARSGFKIRNCCSN